MCVLLIYVIGGLKGCFDDNMCQKSIFQTRFSDCYIFGGDQEKSQNNYEDISVLSRI